MPVAWSQVQVIPWEEHLGNEHGNTGVGQKDGPAQAQWDLADISRISLRAPTACEREIAGVQRQQERDHHHGQAGLLADLERPKLHPVDERRRGLGREDPRIPHQSLSG